MHTELIFLHKISLKGHTRLGVLRKERSPGVFKGAAINEENLFLAKFNSRALNRRSPQHLNVKRSWRLKPEQLSDGGGGDKDFVVLKLPSPTFSLCQPLCPCPVPSRPLLL